MSSSENRSGPTSTPSGEPSRSGKLWGGRFEESTDTFVERFTASVTFDQRLAPEDIAGSLAHAGMLCEVGLLSESEHAEIRAGLAQIGAEIASGSFEWSVPLEDVHMNIEARLTEKIGVAGKKLHTGRSRNDQVATDLRLHLRAAIDRIDALLERLGMALIDQAERHAGTIMPGFTHLQTAQPVTLGHHLLAWLEMLLRDRDRLADCRRRVDVMPLGAAALAGTSYPIDRNRTAATLAFSSIAANSLDAVSDRDFVIEFLATASIAMVHYSRWCEELILWASAQFEFVDLPDRFCTGSSIMPQKKNPDVPELVRGKTGRVCGHLVALLMLMKAQPLAYNKDNQEDKEPLFDAIDTWEDSLTALVGLVPALRFRADRMRAAAVRGYATATDLADYVVGRGIPFRDAHEIVGKAVAAAIERGVDLAELPLTELQGFCQAIGADVYEVLTPEGSAALRSHPGGTAPATVLRAAQQARERLTALGR